jgi:hypothetical protein
VSKPYDLEGCRLDCGRQFAATRTATAGEDNAGGTFDITVELSGALSAVTSAPAAVDTGRRRALAGSVSRGPAVATNPERKVPSLA